MAAEAIASTSQTQNSLGTTSVTSWSPLSVDLAYQQTWAWYGLSFYNWMASLNFSAAPPPNPHQNLGDRTSRKRKVNTAEVQSVRELRDTGSTPDSTRLLFDSRRGRVTFKPYSDISQNLTSLPGEYTQPLKRRHLDGLRGTNGQHHGQNGQKVAKNRAQIIQPDRGCTIGNLFPEVLSIIFEYLDEQSKGRVAQVCHQF